MASLSDISRRTIHTVFKYLSFQELVSVRAVSRFTKSMVDSYYVVMDKLDLLKIPRISSEVFQQLIEKTSSVRKLKLDCSSLMTSDLDRIPSTVSILKLRVLRPEFILNPDFRPCLEKFSHLQLLKINFSDSDILKEIDEDMLDEEIAQISRTINLFPFFDYNFGHIKFFDLRSDEDISRQQLSEFVRDGSQFKLNLRKFDCELKLKHIKMNKYSIDNARRKYSEIEIFNFLETTIGHNPQGVIVVSINTKNTLTVYPMKKSPCTCDVTEDQQQLEEFAIIARCVKYVTIMKMSQIQPRYFSQTFDILKKLKGIKLQCSGMKPYNIRELQSIRELKCLRFRSIKFGLIRKEFEDLLRRTSLVDLDIRKTNFQFTDFNFKIICQMTSLQKLKLSSDSINDTMIAHLPTLKRLTNICFHNCIKLTSHGLRNLAYLNNLTHLEIALFKQGCGIQLDDLNFIIERIGRNLQTVNFFQSKFQDEYRATSILADVCTNLRYLMIPLDEEFASSIKSRFRSLLKFSIEYNRKIDLRSND